MTGGIRRPYRASGKEWSRVRRDNAVVAREAMGPSNLPAHVAIIMMVRYCVDGEWRHRRTDSRQRQKREGIRRVENCAL